MAPNNIDFDLKQICFNRFKFPDDKIFQDYRDPDLNEINTQNKKATYLNENDIKNFL